MALAITHSTVVTVPDDGTSPVGTNEWNAGHVVSGNLPVSQLNGGSGATSATFWRGDGTWQITAGPGDFTTVNPYGTDYNIVNPSIGNSSGYGDGIRLAITVDTATSALIPGFVEERGLNVNSTYLHGDDSNATGAVAKTTIIPISLNSTYIGAGQRSGIAQVIDGYGMGDLAYGSGRMQYYCGPGNGDEGIGYALTTTIHQAQAKSLATITAVTRTSFSTTTTQIVTGSQNVQTITVASTTNANVNDWIIMNQSVDTGTNLIEAVQITAVGVGTISGIFRYTYPNGTTITPALVLGVTTTGTFGQLRVVVNLSGTSYSTGTISGNIGGALTGSGTTWTNGIVGGSALNVGAITLVKDNYTGFPYSGGNPLKSWYQITGVSSSTSLGIHSFSIAADQGYRGFGSFPSNYIIQPAARIMRVNGAFQIICETSTATWTVGDNIECIVCPYPDLTGISHLFGGYTPGGTYRAYIDVENDGARTFQTGINMAARGSAWGTVRTDGGDYFAWGTGIQISNAQTGIIISGDGTTATTGINLNGTGVGINFQGATSISANAFTGIDIGTIFRFGLSSTIGGLNGLLIAGNTIANSPTTRPEALLDIDAQVAGQPGIIIHVNFGHSVDLMTFKDTGFGTSLAGVDQNAIYYAHAVRHTASTFANIVSGANVEGTLAAITDSTTKTLQATITGTGGFHVLGYYNGTNWIVAAAAP